MRKWFLILMLAALLALPSLALAQTNVALANVNVQLWPEYDQPSMLVIVDYSVSADTKLPVDIKFRIPQSANLIAVANYSTDGSLLNAVVDNPKPDGDWQVFTVNLDSMKGHFEYYQPITFNGEQRTFSYLWNDPYAVDSFNMRVLEPLDVTSLTTTPKLDSTTQENNAKYYVGAPVKLAATDQYSLNLEYKKTSNTLISASPTVQPVAPLDNNTAGRVSLNNSLPYIIGGVGLLLIIGGVVYYMLAGKTDTRKSRRRARGKSDEEEVGSDIYCSQCGTRARNGDRFCRTCGSRIKQQED